MKVEVGKVYKCGDTFVYIEYKSRKLDEWDMFEYIGLTCDKLGNLGSERPTLGRFSIVGGPSETNQEKLMQWLEEVSERETITIGSSVYYKDEFEAAVKHLKEVKQ